jgi:type I restriction enzyme, S subunit
VSDLPTGWIKALVINVTDIKTGKLDANAAHSNGAYPFFTCAEDVSRINTYSFDTEAVLLAGNGFFNVKWYKGRFDAYQRTYVICPLGINGRFLYYTILWLIPKISEKSRGSTIKYLRLGDIQDTELLLPPLSEQTRIVAKLEELLSDLDAGVAELKAAQKKLAQYRQSLLKAAVDGSLTAEWRKNNPPTETGAELLERILKERRTRWEAKQLAKFKEQGKTPPKDWQKKYAEPNPPDKATLFDLPGNWTWSSVEQLAELMSGHTPKNAENSSDSDGDIGWFKVGDMNKPGNDVWLTNAEIKFDLQTALSLGMKPAPMGTIVFPKRGGAIATNKKRRLANVSCFDLNTMGLIPNSHVADWLWSYFQGVDLGQLSSGSNVPQINNPDIAPLCVPLPPSDEQLEIIRLLTVQLESTFEQEENIYKSLKQAAAQRQNILRAAFAGQLVPQDPNDEPASVLLERIRAERAAQTKPKARGRKKTAPEFEDPTLSG